MKDKHNIKVFREPLYKTNGNGNTKLINMIYKYKRLNNYSGFHIYKVDKHSTHVRFRV